MGSVGNFDKVLKIDAKGHLTIVGGPLDVDAGFVVKKIYVWVIQQRTKDAGAAAVGFQDSAGLAAATEAWTTRADVVTDGTFEEGVAFAMALAVVKEPETNQDKVRWWLETVILKKE